MSLFTWSLALLYPFLVILDLYYNWDRIGVDKNSLDKKCLKPIAKGSEIYKHPLLVDIGIKDPACAYELLPEEEPLLITEVSYYDDSRGVRKYRTIHI